jgi:hypothetical protein
MSLGQGKFRIELIGQPQWGECIYLLDNDSRGKDIFLSGSANSQWTYKNGWTKVQDINFGANTGVSFFNRPQDGMPSVFALSPLNGNPDNTGVYLHRWLDGKWQENWTGGFRIPAKRVQATDGRTVMDTPLTTIDNRDFIWSMFGGSCQIQRNPGATALEAIVLFNGIEVVGGYHGQVAETYGPGASIIYLFEVNSTGTLEKKPITIVNQKVYGITPTGLFCSDINGDGYQDIVLHNTNIQNSNDVLVYLNDRNGGFGRVDPKVFPPSPEGFGFLRNYRLADINGDGIPDLIYFQIVGDTGRENRLRIHLGNRKLLDQDLLH